MDQFEAIEPSSHYKKKKRKEKDPSTHAPSTHVQSSTDGRDWGFDPKSSPASSDFDEEETLLAVAANNAMSNATGVDILSIEEANDKKKLDRNERIKMMSLKKQAEKKEKGCCCSIC